jgi:hypothetical protein
MYRISTTAIDRTSYTAATAEDVLLTSAANNKTTATTTEAN